MIGHLGLNVPDLDAAKAYYGALMPLLGYEPFFSAAGEQAYMPAEGRRGAYLFLYAAKDPAPYSRHAPGLQHLAFALRGRGDVRAVHAHVVEQGSEVVHAPREFTEYPPPYFATFWLDPFGFMLEAVCHRDVD
jgi:catechol 2,3-dioxygenase-like lactoylglutathione lyase family enzyme